MLILAGVAVLTVAVALHIAWIAKRAEARGRSALAWVGLGLALGAIGLRGGVALMVTAANGDNNGLMALFATAPFTLTLAPMIMPTGKPANREGRVRQAQAIAERLRT